MTDMMQFTPDEEAEFGNLSDHDMMDPVEKQIVEHLQAIAQTMAQTVSLLSQLQQSIAQLAQSVSAPRKATLVRDQTGKATHSISEIA